MERNQCKTEGGEGRRAASARGGETSWGSSKTSRAGNAEAGRRFAGRDTKRTGKNGTGDEGRRRKTARIGANIRSGQTKISPEKNIIRVNANDLLINNVFKENNTSSVQKIEIDNKGDFRTHWRDGFFSERLDDLF